MPEYWEIRHAWRKLKSTVSMTVNLFFARTFGRYDVSVHADGVNYARYHWRGKVWAFPTGPVEDKP